MGYFRVSETPPEDGQVYAYDADTELFVPVDQGAGPHAATHQNGGSDEIDVTGLSGVLADDQKANKIRTTTGPTLLSVGAVADGEFLKRSGSTVIGGTPSGGGGGSGRSFQRLATTSSSWTTSNSTFPSNKQTLVTWTGVIEITSNSSSGWVGVTLVDNGGSGISGASNQMGFIAVAHNKGPGDPAGDASANVEGGGMYARVTSGYTGFLALWGYYYVQTGATAGKLAFIHGGGNSGNFIAGSIAVVEDVP